MSSTPYRPVVTEGDPKQQPSGCNITQPAGNVSTNQPSAAQIAAKGQEAYAAYQAQNEAWRTVIERPDRGTREGQPKGRMLRPDQIA
jgi:hypothetical protein